MDTSQHDSSVARPPKRSWRRHSEEFKSRVIGLARQGHGSVAAVALANGLNANMLRRWVREAELADVAPAVSRAQTLLNPPAFVPVAVTDLVDRSAAATEPREPALPPMLITVEIRRGASSVSASLPMDSRSAAWLREVLA
jgi:transposase-like protein